MPTVLSADGTTIGYERSGTGPAIVLVDGALCHRAGGPMRPLAAALAGNFTVYAYDRRGRGESGDTLPYALEREVEDLRAVVDVAAQDGNPVAVYGISSGAALALHTAAVDPRIARIVLYEPPYVASANPAISTGQYRAALDAALAAGRRGDAVALFLEQVGVPAPVIAGMRGGPGWPAMEAIAPTLPYDDTVITGGRIPYEQAKAVGVPVLVLAGDASPPIMREAAEALAGALSVGRYATLAGQTHDVAPQAVAPAITEFLRAGA
jgi:pimeloyl-ACP methyl ester carboxylesterase